jgi:hypothetical protein
MRLALHRVTREIAQALLRLILEHEPQQRSEERVVRLRAVAERSREPGSELEADAGLGIRHADADEPAQQLAERVVGNLLRVRDPLHAQESHLLAPPLPGLCGEPALTDAGLAGDGDDRPATDGGAFQNVVEHGHLGVTPDQRRDAAPDFGAITFKPVALDRLGPSFHLQGAERLQLEHVLDLSRRDRAERDAAGAGVDLEACCDVDRVTERVVALGRRRFVAQEDDRAGVDADSRGELDAVRLAEVMRVAG